MWRKNLGKYADSLWVTPDGKRLYVPFRDEADWKVIDAADGSILARIETERGRNYEVDPIATIGPHNTWINPAGTRAYLEVLTVPYIYVADTMTNRILGKIGPFSKGIRPFAVSDDEKYIYANVDGLLGFEIAEIQKNTWSGRMIHRVEARTPSARLAEIPEPPSRKPHSTPSHGINLRPDQKEVWMVDGVYGYVYAFDVTSLPPKQIASIPIFQDPKERPHPGWDHVWHRRPLRVSRRRDRHRHENEASGCPYPDQREAPRDRFRTRQTDARWPSINWEGGG